MLALLSLLRSYNRKLRIAGPLAWHGGARPAPRLGHLTCSLADPAAKICPRRRDGEPPCVLVIISECKRPSSRKKGPRNFWWHVLHWIHARPLSPSVYLGQAASSESRRRQMHGGDGGDGGELVVVVVVAATRARVCGGRVWSC